MEMIGVELDYVDHFLSGVLNTKTTIRFNMNNFILGKQNSKIQYTQWIQ